MSSKTRGKYAGPLPQTAQRLVEAGHRILLKDGCESLTLDALAEEAKLNKSLVRYYFGGKEGLMQALVDSVFPDYRELIDALDRVETGREQVQSLLKVQRIVSADRDVNRVLYELLPRILRDRDLRRRFAKAYSDSRRLDAGCVEAAAPGIDAAQARRLAALSVAVLEGLAMQREIDPKGLDHDGTFAEWEHMLTEYLRKFQRGSQSQE